MEVLLEIANHSLAWIPVRPQERVIVTNAVQTLSNVLLTEVTTFIAGCQGLNGLFFAFDVLLNFAA